MVFATYYIVLQTFSTIFTLIHLNYDSTDEFLKLSFRVLDLVFQIYFWICTCSLYRSNENNESSKHKETKKIEEPEIVVQNNKSTKNVEDEPLVSPDRYVNDRYKRTHSFTSVNSSTVRRNTGNTPITGNIPVGKVGAIKNQFDKKPEPVKPIPPQKKVAPVHETVDIDEELYDEFD